MRYAASLRVTRGSKVELEIALNGVSAKDQPHELLQLGRRCVETSGDVIRSSFVWFAAMSSFIPQTSCVGLLVS